MIKKAEKKDIKWCPQSVTIQKFNNTNKVNTESGKIQNTNES